jgi:hypothetical protein
MNNIAQHARSIKLRKRLEDVFRNVSLAHDVVALCVELSQGDSGAISTPRSLKSCGDAPLTDCTSKWRF